MAAHRAVRRNLKKRAQPRAPWMRVTAADSGAHQGERTVEASAPSQLRTGSQKSGFKP